MPRSYLHVYSHFTCILTRPLSAPATYMHLHVYVVRRACTMLQVTRKSHFHEDFGDTGGRAFTLMTPLYDMAAIDDCHLLCDVGGGLKQYRYRLGEAVVFGDTFVHATQTGHSPQPLGFLCFTFGARKMTPEQWRSAEQYIEAQGPIYQTPAGVLVSSTVVVVKTAAGVVSKKTARG